MTGQHGRVADILRDHRLADPVRAEQYQVACFFDEVERQRSFDHLAIDLLGPRPVEVSHRFEALDSGRTQPPFEAATHTVATLDLNHLFEDYPRRRAVLRRTSDEVIEVLGERS